VAYSLEDDSIFVDYQQELVFLNNLLERQHPGPAQSVDVEVLDKDLAT
jgi:hypothetical protein